MEFLPWMVRRQDIRSGLTVEVALKQDQATGKEDPRGGEGDSDPFADASARIKVRLTNGAAGRVKSD